MTIEEIREAYRKGTLKDINPETPSYNRINLEKDDLQTIKWKLDQQQKELDSAEYSGTPIDTTQEPSTEETEVKGTMVKPDVSAVNADTKVATDNQQAEKPSTKTTTATVNTTYNSYSSESGNATNGRTLKRMKIEYKDISINFAVNPEEYTQKEPNRATLTQTKGGAWIDAWGKGIVEITLRGITGMGGANGTVDTGYTRWKELRNLFLEVYNATTDGEEIGTDGLIRFYNFTDNEFFYCYPTQNGIDLTRSKSRPHLYQYTINLWAIRRIGEPEQSVGVIGNPNAPTAEGTNVTTKSQSQVTSTTVKSSEVIKITAEERAGELAKLVGGKNGKISPVTASGVAKSLTVQATGLISNVIPFNGSKLVSLIKGL